MKSRVALCFALAAVLVAVAAAAQTAPSQPSAQKAEKKDPLFFVKIATDIAGNIQQRSLNDFLGIYIDSDAWDSGLKDGDLGPFLKLKEGKAGRSAAILLSAAKDVEICVFFDGDKPFGVAAAKASASGKIEAKDIEAAYKPVSPEMLEKSEHPMHFEPSEGATDDGRTVPVFQLSTGVKFPS